MSTSTTGPHNHWRCRGNCAGVPLTLADRELITGRDIACPDGRGGWLCGDCLADLPGTRYEALFHVCGQERETAPEPAAVQPPPPAGAPAPRKPRKGDVVFYHGRLTEYRGVYEVVSARGGRLRLLDMDRCLDGVRPADVTVGGRVKRSRRH